MIISGVRSWVALSAPLLMLGLSGCVLLTTPSDPAAVAVLRSERQAEAAQRASERAAITRPPVPAPAVSIAPTPAPSRASPNDPQPIPTVAPAPARTETGNSGFVGANDGADAEGADDYAAIAGNTAQLAATIARLDARLIDDPTDLDAAEQLGLLAMARDLPDDGDWDDAMVDFRAAQDALRTGNALDPDTAESSDSRWAAARRASIDTDARQLFTMTHRDQWLLAWTPDLPDHVRTAIRPYHQAVIAQALRDHLFGLQMILSRIGWFDISRYGETASQAAWLIIQHADFDPSYQRAMVSNLRPRVERGDFQPRYFGYLIDRVAVNAGEPQTYATQGRCVATADGLSLWQPFAMIDPDQVDVRRSSVGLEPLASYATHFTC